MRDSALIIWKKNVKIMQESYFHKKARKEKKNWQGFELTGLTTQTSQIYHVHS